MKTSILSILIVLFLVSCGKPSAPRDLLAMAKIAKVGMTPEEVIRAIGKPDTDSDQDPELRGKSKPGNRVFFYQEGPTTMLTVAFRNFKVAKVTYFTPPPGWKPGG